ncbi:hypothetical protein AB8Y43_15265, partial [Listeria monocytogenes]|uniref:hypothetical protein n=1 Tax=Listeria monocytogenes TaxID=1639 RepID=UPI00350E5909
GRLSQLERFCVANIKMQLFVEAHMLVLHDWLEDRISERRGDIGPSSDITEYYLMAGSLKAQALADGYDPNDLDSICGGNIATYILTFLSSSRSVAH